MNSVFTNDNENVIENILLQNKITEVLEENKKLKRQIQQLKWGLKIQEFNYYNNY